MTLPRLTIRRSMLAVAILAALIWFTILAMRSLENHRQARSREAICQLLSGEIKLMTEDAEKARAAGTPTTGLEAAIGERKKALVEEQRAATLFRDRTWRPWRTVRYR